MSLFVDTSVWSLSFRRDAPSDEAVVERLASALQHGEDIFTTGLVLQELLQGFRGPKAQRSIVDRFRSLPFVAPSREDHVEAAMLRNQCRRRGIQIGTIDALIARLCLHHELDLLTADRDFAHIAKHFPLRLALQI